MLAPRVSLHPKIKEWRSVCLRATAWPWKRLISYKTAIFRQINRDKQGTHHDALEFPDGQLVLLTFLLPGQQATVLQLPAATEGIEAKEQPAAIHRELDLADTFS
jgi:hypothetical protein